MTHKRTTVRVEELTLTNTLQLTAIVGLLEERGINAASQPKAPQKRRD